MQTNVVAKTIVFDDAGNVLAMWRAADDRHRPGGFDFPGGKVDKGESIPQGAARELAEEAGLEIKETDLQLTFALTKATYNTEAKTDINIVWLGFIAKLPPGQTVKLSHEHDRFEWLSPSRALEICDGPTQATFLEHILAHNFQPQP